MQGNSHPWGRAHARSRSLNGGWRWRPERTLASTDRAAALCLNRAFSLACWLGLSGCALAPTQTTVLADCSRSAVDLPRADGVVPLAAGTRRIVIDQPEGSLFVRAGAGDRVEWHAVVQCPKSQRGAPSLRVENRGGRQELQVGFVGAGSDATDRIDLTVWVPRQLALELVTDSGRIEVRGHRASVRARSASGAISVAAAGELHLTSVSGDIDASPRDTDRAWPMTIETGGAVRLVVLRSLPVSLDLLGLRGVDHDLDAVSALDVASTGARLQVKLPGAVPTLRVRAGGTLVVRGQDLVPDLP